VEWVEKRRRKGMGGGKFVKRGREKDREEEVRRRVGVVVMRGWKGGGRERSLAEFGFIYFSLPALSISSSGVLRGSLSSPTKTFKCAPLELAAAPLRLEACIVLSFT
jgi:hypothetical protein